MRRDRLVPRNVARREGELTRRIRPELVCCPGDAATSPGSCALRSCETEGVRVIAAGRASEIVDIGDGRILRRFKRVGDAAREAKVMEYARARAWVPGSARLDVVRDGPRPRTGRRADDAGGSEAATVPAVRRRANAC